MQLLVVHLMSSCCVHRGLHLVRRRVATQSRMCLFPLYTRAHTCYKKIATNKKKIALVIRGCCRRNEEETSVTVM
jgi:hypothetical protein